MGAAERALAWVCRGCGPEIREKRSGDARLLSGHGFSRDGVLAGWCVLSARGGFSVAHVLAGSCSCLRAVAMTCGERTCGVRAHHGVAHVAWCLGLVRTFPAPLRTSSLRRTLPLCSLFRRSLVSGDVDLAAWPCVLLGCQGPREQGHGSQQDRDHTLNARTCVQVGIQ